jgi:hypothetical protein
VTPLAELDVADGYGFLSDGEHAGALRKRFARIIGPVVGPDVR